MIRWGHFWSALIEWAGRHGLQAEELSPLETAIVRDLARGDLRNSGAINVVPPMWTQPSPEDIQ